MRKLGKALVLVVSVALGLWTGGFMAADLIWHSQPPGPWGLTDYILLLSDIFMSLLAAGLAGYLSYFLIWECLVKELGRCFSAKPSHGETE